MIDMIGKRIELVRNVCNLWDGEQAVPEGTQGVITCDSEHDSCLFMATLDDGRTMWLVPPDFKVLEEERPPPRFAVIANSAVYYGAVLQMVQPATTISFGSNISINYAEDPPRVELRGTPPDLAARQFWNAVHAVIGRPPLFPEDVS